MIHNDSEDHLDEDILRVFIWSVWNFFGKSTRIEPEIGAPHIFESLDHCEYTGIIGVSGLQKGAIYFNMDGGLLDQILNDYHSNAVPSDADDSLAAELRKDYAGEMANIVAGNVRNYLGEHFLISVPVVVTEPESPIELPDQTYGIVFPINWDGHICQLVLCLEKNRLETRNSA